MKPLAAATGSLQCAVTLPLTALFLALTIAPALAQTAAGQEPSQIRDRLVAGLEQAPLKNMPAGWFCTLGWCGPPAAFDKFATIACLRSDEAPNIETWGDCLAAKISADKVNYAAASSSRRQAARDKLHALGAD